MRFTKKDWIQKGFDFLNNEGSHALMIDHMCDRLKITKGSFYHYFVGIDEYIHLVVKYWEQDALNKLDQLASSGASAKEKFNRMRDFVFSYSGKMEIGLRSLSLQSRKLKTIVGKMERKRLDMMTAILVESGAGKSRATGLAELIHSSWVGILTCELELVDRERALGMLNEMVMKEM